jgi:hypothetical protein
MQMDSFNTPILLISFNRPNHTKRVFEEVKKQKPRFLFVFQDAPRPDKAGDADNCRAVRDIFLESIDWDCELRTYYAQDNLGCGRGPSSAITWFFENVEQGIIFEDDCLPHPDFFQYCQQLLEEYKADEHVSFIAGSNFQNGIMRGDGSYYFSSGSYGTWGWATWKRSWDHFDYLIERIDKQEMKKLIKKYFIESRQKSFWLEIYEHVKKDRYNETCWDYQFYFSCWRHNMAAIIPNKNLITNIGYDEQGTHTFSDNHPAANVMSTKILPLIKPTCFNIDKKADFYLQKHFTQPYEYGFEGFKRIPHRINKSLKKLIGYKGKWLNL